MIRVALLGASLLLLLAVVLLGRTESTRDAYADSTPTPSPPVMHGDVNCDQAFTIIDPLALVQDLAGLDSNIACALGSGFACNGQLYPNATVLLIGELAGVVAKIPPCLPPTPEPTPVDQTPTPTPQATPA